MSELTRCNYCTLQDMKLVAKQTGRVVTVRPSKRDQLDLLYPDSKDIFIHPPDKQPEGWWAAWLAEIPDHCVC